VADERSSPPLRPVCQPPPVPGPLFVAVEGIDHSGKTTLTRGLAEQLRARGLRVAVMKEPTSGPVGTLLRQLSADPAVPAVALALLSAADRHVGQSALDTALAGHDVVVADRYLLSGLAYHLADGVDIDFYRVCADGVRLPDVYLYLDVVPAVAATRVRRPPDSRWEESAFAARLPAAYQRGLAIVTAAPACGVIHLDAHQPAVAVLAAALAAVIGRLPRTPGRNAA
jgi:dTMP kinase